MTSPGPHIDPAPAPEGPTPAGKSKGRGLALAALLVGAGAFLIGWVPAIGALVAVVGIVLGVVALRVGQSKAMSWTGIVLGALAAITSVIVLVVAIGNADFTPKPAEDDVAEAPIETTEAPAETTPSAAPTPTATPTPTPTPAATPTTTPEPPAASLAADVQAAVLEGLVADSFQESCEDGITWVCDIVEVRDSRFTGYVEVVVSGFPSQSQAESVGRGFMNFSCDRVLDLKAITVLDEAGNEHLDWKRSDSLICP